MDWGGGFGMFGVMMGVGEQKIKDTWQGMAINSKHDIYPLQRVPSPVKRSSHHCACKDTMDRRTLTLTQWSVQCFPRGKRTMHNESSRRDIEERANPEQRQKDSERGHELKGGLALSH